MGMRAESSASFVEKDTVCCGCFLPGMLRGRCVVFWQDFCTGLKEKVKAVWQWFLSFFPARNQGPIDIGPDRKKVSSSYSAPPNSSTPSTPDEEEKVVSMDTTSDVEVHLNDKRNSSSNSSTLNTEKEEEKSGSSLMDALDNEDLELNEPLFEADFKNCYQEIWQIFGHEEAEKKIDTWDLSLVRDEYSSAISLARQARKQLESKEDFSSPEKENVGLLACFTVLNFLRDRTSHKTLPFDELNLEFQFLDPEEIEIYKNRMTDDSPEFLGTGEYIHRALTSATEALYKNPYFTFVLTEAFFPSKSQ